MQDRELDLKRVECAQGILDELRRSCAAADGSMHSNAFDRFMDEYLPRLEGERISLAIFAELIAVNGAVCPELLRDEQRMQLLEVGGFVITPPLKEYFKEHIHLEEKGIHYKEEYESAVACLKSVEGSTSFRLGRVATAIPRRIKSAIR